jgi:hypothetical protein
VRAVSHSTEGAAIRDDGGSSLETHFFYKVNISTLHALGIGLPFSQHPGAQERRQLTEAGDSGRPLGRSKQGASTSVS